jgi:hypothetical protein
LQQIRAISPSFEQDRPLGREIETIAESLVGSGRLIAV